MVTRLYGKCDGSDIIFHLVEDTGRWETTVPASANGTYIIELWAEDDAGNVGYFATIQVTYDPTKLCCRIELLDVGAAFSVEEVLHVLQGDGFSSCVEMVDVRWAIEPEKIMSKIVRCEVCNG